MSNPTPTHLILPFQAQDIQTEAWLSFEETRKLFPAGRVRITRSYPGAPHAIGWTVFYRQPRAFAYLGEPLFESESKAQHYFRRTYRPEKDAFDELYTYSHI